MLKKLLSIAMALYAAAAMAAIDVNTAKSDQLAQIKGIGAVTATHILDARQQGAFTDWDDLIQRVKGIGSASASKFSEQGLTVNGKPYKTKDQPPKKATKPSEKSVNPSQTTGSKQEKK